MNYLIRTFLYLLISIRIVMCFSEAHAITIQSDYSSPNKLFSNDDFNKINPQKDYLIYINPNSKIAISQSGKIYFLETDYSGNIIGIRDQHGQVISLRNDISVNRLEVVFNNMNTNHIFNPYYYLPSN